MQNPSPTLTKPRVAFLLSLALGITLLFFWVIRGFVVPLLVAAVLAGLAHPFYRRVANRLGERRTLASGVTVVLSLLVVVIPLMLFLGIFVGEAISISESAQDWVNAQLSDTESLERRIEEDPDLKRLLPYQDEILTKAGELASRAGTFVATGLAAGARGTAEFLLMVFVMLYAMFYFLIDGPMILDSVLRFTPLSESDKARLLGTFASVGRATLKGTYIIGIVQGGLAGLAFWVAGIQGAIFWGAVMAVLSVIPGIGAALVWIPGVAFLALNGQTGAAAGVALWCGLVVGTADNVLRPLLIGKETEMPDLLVMLTTIGGLALFGAVGLLVGPLIGALYVTVWKLWSSAMDENGTDAGTASASSEG